MDQRGRLDPVSGVEVGFFSGSGAVLKYVSLDPLTVRVGGFFVVEIS